jgi:dTDP-4-dehydrorhamnose reductase
MSHILLVGKNGQIGWELHRILQNLPVNVVAVARAELDVTDQKAVMGVCETVKPDIVINATGYNDVDTAEQNSTDATSVNVTGNANLSQAARKTKAFYISYSSDYVFDGRKNLAYTEADLPNPVNIYGKTKLDGELAIKDSGVEYLIIRTSSVFSLRRPCFLSNFIKKAQQGAQIPVRIDLVSSPTSAWFLAENTAKIITSGKKAYSDFLKEKAGIYHLAGRGSASRYEWAQAIQNLLKLDVDLLPASSLDFPSGTSRPVFSALDSSKFVETFQVQLVPWQQQLKNTLTETS